MSDIDQNGTALLTSSELKSPISWGLFRPVILLNEEALEARHEAEAIIAHELAHVRGLDWAKLLLARIVTAIFWFNPLVWLAARQAAGERLVILDSDDPDTPGAPFLPAWATPSTVAEGIAVGATSPTPTTGNPADDRNPASSGIYNSKPPSVTYSVIFPDGQSFLNSNPSGNVEWEQFRVSRDPFDPAQMDHQAAVIPAGTYELRGIGVDMQNLNALLLPGRLLCVQEDGTPCTPLRPFLVGDLVTTDCVDEDPNEPPLPGVVLELIDSLGAVITTTITDADGLYSFPVEAGTHTVHVADSNFDPGGALEGYTPRSPLSLTADVVDSNVLTFDFGFCPAQGSIGDQVWQDDDGNGLLDGSEAGIPDVFVELLDGVVVIDSVTTDFNGNYSFSNLNAGTYTVRIDPLSVPSGLSPTFDLDGIGTPHVAEAVLASGQTRTDVDFGYGPGGNASLGDRVWYDSNGNGAQDDGATGLSGVTVELLDGGGVVIATTITGANGLYGFNHLAAGSYTVRVVSSTLPPGLAPTYDLDGIGTAHTAAATLTGGQNRTDVDFGYRGTASLGDRVWYDTDGNGAQDDGATGLAGVTIELLDGGGVVIATTITGCSFAIEASPLADCSTEPPMATW